MWGANEKRHRAARGIHCVIALPALGSAVTARADNIFESVNTQLTASAGGQHIDYKETAQNQQLDSEKGFQGSYQGQVSVQRDMLGIKDVFLSASFAYAKGRTNYDGSLMDGTPLQAGTRANTSDITVKIGKAFPFTPQGQVIYYVYYGYHQWLRDSTSVYGYDEHYRHHSAGVGMIGQYAVTPQLVASIEGSVGGTFAASMNANIIQGKFNLGSAATLMGAVGLDYAVTRHFHVKAAYQITHFKYGKSNLVDGAYYEPDSTTTNQTVRLGVGYAF